MIENCILMSMVIGLSELLKRVRLVSSKFLPLWNIVMALMLYLFYRGFTPEGIFFGLALGIGATGLYSAFKNVLEGMGFIFTHCLKS